VTSSSSSPSQVSAVRNRSCREQKLNVFCLKIKKGVEKEGKMDKHLEQSIEIHPL